jgi:hypothetical protein
VVIPELIATYDFLIKRTPVGCLEIRAELIAGAARNQVNLL